MLALRGRRGHDLRRTFVSHAQEDGAVRHALETVRHGPGGNIMSMYTSYSWEALCTEVGKFGSDSLQLVTVRPRHHGYS